MPITGEEAKSKYFEKVKCVICSKGFWRKKKPRSGMGVKGIRGPKTKTCSPKCSRLHSAYRNKS